MAVMIRPFEEQDAAQLIALSMRAWAPVFRDLRPAVPAYVYDAFYPQGWQKRQADDIAQLLAAAADNFYVATVDAAPVGFVGVRFHAEDKMGEIHIIAVDPPHQRRGVAKALIDHASDVMRAEGLAMVMVETGGDPGHAVSRATYESAGFERWPVARYFRKL